MSDYFAKVNGRPISAFDYQNALQGYSMDMYRKTMDQLSADELKAIEDLAREKLLARELIFQEALAQGVVAEDANISQEMDKIIRNFPSEEEFYGTLQKAGIDAASYRRMIRQDLTVNLMTTRKLASLDEPSAEKVEEVYRRYPEQMQSPERVRASHILVKVKEGGREAALAEARSLQQRAQTEDFAALAQEHSSCPSAARGGDLGYFRRGDMVKAFDEAAFSQPEGAVGDIVETQFGFHLIKVLAREKAVNLSLEEATPKIKEFLKGEAGARLLKEWVEELMAKAEISFAE